MEDSNIHYGFEEATATAVPTANHGWQKVTYSKKRKNQQQDNKQKPATAVAASVGSSVDKDGNVFRAIEQQSEDRHRRIVEAQRKSAAFDDDDDVARKPRSKKRDDSDDSESDKERENGNIVEKGDNKEKKKKKKADKRPKVSVSEAASKLDAGDLSAFLIDLSVSGSNFDLIV